MPLKMCLLGLRTPAELYSAWHEAPAVLKDVAAADMPCFSGVLQSTATFDAKRYEMKSAGENEGCHISILSFKVFLWAGLRRANCGPFLQLSLSYNVVDKVQQIMLASLHDLSTLIVGLLT